MNRTSNIKLYRAWYNMNTRCNVSGGKDAEWYYDKGVKVCDRWLSFESFREDMEDSWEDGLWLDRINPDGDYSPENCRWVSPSRQQINRKVRKTSPSNQKGVFLRPENNKWRTGIMINEKWKWLGTFEDLEDAIRTRQDAERKYYG